MAFLPNTFVSQFTKTALRKNLNNSIYTPSHVDLNSAILLPEPMNQKRAPEHVLSPLCQTLSEIFDNCSATFILFAIDEDEGHTAAAVTESFVE